MCGITSVFAPACRSDRDCKGRPGIGIVYCNLKLQICDRLAPCKSYMDCKKGQFCNEAAGVCIDEYDDRKFNY